MGDGNWVSPASDFSSPSPRAAYEVEDEDMIDDVDACAPCAPWPVRKRSLQAQASRTHLPRGEGVPYPHDIDTTCLAE